MRVIVFIITAGFQVAAAAVGFLLLLLGLNGFSERQATPSLVLYVALSLMTAIGLGVASAFAARRLAGRKSLSSWGGAAVAVAGFCVVGVLILIAAFFAALVLAEAVRGAA